MFYTLTKRHYPYRAWPVPVGYPGLRLSITPEIEPQPQTTHRSTFVSAVGGGEAGGPHIQRIRPHKCRDQSSPSSIKPKSNLIKPNQTNSGQIKPGAPFLTAWIAIAGSTMINPRISSRSRGRHVGPRQHPMPGQRGRSYQPRRAWAASLFSP